MLRGNKNERLLVVIVGIIGCLPVAGAAQAQQKPSRCNRCTSTLGQPTAFTHAIQPLQFVEQIVPEPIDLEAVQMEDELREQRGGPYRFAIPRRVMITPDINGTWEGIGDETLLWRLHITSPTALSINLGFTRYYMPPGARLFIYAADHSQVLGPYTENDNKEHGQLWTPLIHSDDIVVELTIPASEVPQLELELSSINHGYRYFGPVPPVTELGASELCNVNVACPEGDDWRDQIRSVAKYTIDGDKQCSGTLLNNTAEDDTPYFLTAEHCGVDNASAPSMVVYWNYQSETCDCINEGQCRSPCYRQHQQSGATFRASYNFKDGSDFALVELDNKPDSCINVYYAGWYRCGAAEDDGGVAIHHPQGDLKKISIENDPISIQKDTLCMDGFGCNSSGNDYLRVADWDKGTVEPGSSGSPLFNKNKHVVGTTTSRAGEPCGENDKTWFGRFHVSWEGGGNPSSRLKDCLDPYNLRPAILNGKEPDYVPKVDYCSASGTCNGDYIEVVKLKVEGTIIPYYYKSSDCSPGGYGDYTNDLYPVYLAKGINSRITISNHEASEDTKCYLYIDWNRNNDLCDPGESISLSKASFWDWEGSITVPADASGNTRMRIRMGHQTHYYCQCGTEVSGEVEDYTVEVVQSVPGGSPVWPPVGATDVPPDVVLSWTPGVYAASHDVYLGTDFDYVNDANTTVPLGVYKGRQDANSYDPCGLELGTTYYWRIDDFNDTYVPGPNEPSAPPDDRWKGYVWSFTTANFIVVDDFDSYASDADLWGVWNDGWVNGTDSNIFLETDANFTRDGNSMRYEYTNSTFTGGKYIGAMADANLVDLESGPDWTIAGVKALVLYFLGDPCTVIPDLGAVWLWLELEDTGSNTGWVMYPDPNHVTVPTWHEWNIDLSIFDACGVALSSIERLTIGIGGSRVGQKSKATTTNQLWFDDIRLYPVRCRPELAVTDITGDCFTDNADLKIMTDDWLDSDYFIYAEDPCVDGLLVWYKFDEMPSSTVASDSANVDANNYDGTVTDANFTGLGGGWDGIGGALDFNNVGYVFVDANALSYLSDEVTVSFWQYGDPATQPQNDFILEARGDTVDGDQRLLACRVPWGDGTVYWSAGYLEWAGTAEIYNPAEPDDYKGQWNHWAFITYPEYYWARMKIYLNGELWHEYDGYWYTAGYIGDANSFKIGSDVNGVNNYDGKIDELRIYNRALSQAEILYLANVGLAYVPLELPANLYSGEPEGERIVNFRDYGILADNWLAELLWPEP